MTPSDLRLGDGLRNHCERARQELVLCAPFVKRGVIERLLENIGATVTTTVITRWKPEEIAAGVSDTSVLDAVCGRGGRVLLHDRLHAKFYRSDDEVLLGSANLTATALGWSSMPNVELLVPADRALTDVAERLLIEEGVVATQSLADEMNRLAAMFPAESVTTLEEEAASEKPWLPLLRQPRDLFVAYRYGLSRLTEESGRCAAADLEALRLPAGLDAESFAALVAYRLQHQEVIWQLDQYLTEPRRFGAVRDWLAAYLEISADDADASWQTLMRWLLEFLPGRYSRRVARHSEVLVRNGPMTL